MFLADIVAVDVDESLLDDKGKLHLDRAGMAAYMHGEYFALGEELGKFGFSTDKPKKKTSPRPKTAPTAAPKAPKTAPKAAKTPTKSPKGAKKDKKSN